MLDKTVCKGNYIKKTSHQYEIDEAKAIQQAVILIQVNSADIDKYLHFMAILAYSIQLSSLQVPYIFLRMLSCDIKSSMWDIESLAITASRRLILDSISLFASYFSKTFS